MPCPICLEQEIESPAVTLAICGHTFCKSCLEEWVLRVERSRSDDQLPTCPECRSTLCNDDIVSVIGRPLRQSSVPPYIETIETDGISYRHTSINEDSHSKDDYHEPDEFTRVYLENLEAQGEARRCPSCRAWIMLAEGCDNVMCRCGCKFCFCCGQRGSCTGGYFFNNISIVEDQIMSIQSLRRYEEDAETLILPIMTEFWYAEEDYDGPIVDPLFEGNIWNIIVTEPEESRIAPLFLEGSDWEIYPGGCCEDADEGVHKVALMWRDIINTHYDEDDADSVTDYYGSNLFAV